MLKSAEHEIASQITIYAGKYRPLLLSNSDVVISGDYISCSVEHKQGLITSAWIAALTNAEIIK